MLLRFANVLHCYCQAQKRIFQICSQERLHVRINLQVCLQKSILQIVCVFHSFWLYHVTLCEVLFHSDEIKLTAIYPTLMAVTFGHG